MNKDFWERIDRLEELANKVEVKNWVYSGGFDKPAIIAENGSYGVQIVEAVFGGKASDIEYIAAANPAMILEMIAAFKGRLSYLEHKLVETDIQLGIAQDQVKKLEKEANWLAAAQNWDIPAEEPTRCPEGKEPPDGCIGVHDCVRCWREAASKAIGVDNEFRGLDA